jgi:uncharacterized phage-associated protein
MINDRWAHVHYDSDVTMPYDAKAVANFLLDTAKENQSFLTPMKLQKLVYFAHGWCLGLQNRPLINEQVEAWDFGPVIPSLYHKFKDFGNAQITRPASDFDYSQVDFPFVIPTIPTDDTEESTYAIALLTRIWEIYGGFSAAQFSNMTHEADSPWDKVRKQYAKTGMRIPRGTHIPQSDIRDYFLALAQANTKD